MPLRKKLLWQLYPFYVLLSLISVTSVLYVARESWQNGRRTAAQQQGSWLNQETVVAGVLIALISSAAGILVIHHVSRALERTREGARRFAGGDLGFRLDVPFSDELGGLAETLNRMAAQLDERITTINEQRNEQQAILSSMVEGVIAVDRRSSILQVNDAAARLLGTTPAMIIGRSLHEVMRNRELHQLIDATLREGRPAEGETVFYGSSERSLQIHSTPLRDAAGTGIGALVVLNDITRLRRLERVRRDFVANVSHELKTPLTSIKGFVETLLDGALEHPEEARRFSTIIAKQVDRLQAIVEDLLSLSRIEQDVDRGQIPLQPVHLAQALHAAVQTCAPQANEHRIEIHLTCDPEWTASLNGPLFEQVAVNLIDNAIKYSEPGKTVSITVTPVGREWEIAFADQGVGIEKIHLSRIFERFYRIDKARSRKAGGTGLGLSIVKHIVTAHRGRVRVESEVGRGTTFTVCLPRAETATQPSAPATPEPVAAS
jgi:two-component system phosphate regulon sensor histidine kinase PhoR